jgi:hypothetical protein
MDAANSLRDLPLLLKTVSASGMPVTQLPTIESSSDGTRAVTVRGFHYYLLVSCVWRDLQAVLELLHMIKAIGPACGSEWEEESPFAPEYAAMVFQAGIERGPIEVSFMDAAQTRHRPSRLRSPKHPPCDGGRGWMAAPDVMRQIEEVERFSADYESDFARASGTVESTTRVIANGSIPLLAAGSRHWPERRASARSFIIQPHVISRDVPILRCRRWFRLERVTVARHVQLISARSLARLSPRRCCAG